MDANTRKFISNNMARTAFREKYLEAKTAGFAGFVIVDSVASFPGATIKPPADKSETVVIYSRVIIGEWSKCAKTRYVGLAQFRATSP